MSYSCNSHHSGARRTKAWHLTSAELILARSSLAVHILLCRWGNQKRSGHTWIEVDAIHYTFTHGGNSDP